MVTRISIILVSSILYLVSAGDINRQSIIFNENTPDVFYCPQVRLGNCDLSHPFCKLCFQFSGETHFYWPNVSEKQTNEEVVWIWRKRAAWKCEVWLLEWCGWDWICLLSKCNHFMKHWHWLFLEPKEVFQCFNFRRKRESCWEWTLQVMRMPSLTTTSPSTDLENTRSGRQRTWICPRFCKHQWNIIQFLLTDSMSQCIIHQAKFISTCIHVILFRWWNHRLNSSPIYLQSLETLIYCDIVHSSCSNCKMFTQSFISTVLEHLVSQFSNFLVIYS